MVRGAFSKALQDTVRDAHRWEHDEPLLSRVFDPPLVLAEEQVSLRKHGAAWF